MTAETPDLKVSDPALIKKEYEALFDYARGNLVYKCGNLTDMPSRFGWFRRWRLEKQLNYTKTEKPIFLYAYRAFIDALGEQDKKTLMKMCEKSLYNRLVQNHNEVARLSGQYFTVKDRIELKMKLLDTKVITGDVYIDRAKNLSAQYYEVTHDKQDKVIYKKRSKTPMG